MTVHAADLEQRDVPRALVGYLPRLSRWPVLAGGLAVAALVTWWRSGDVIDPVGAVWLMRVVIAIGGVTAVFALDDPSRNVTEWLVATRRLLIPLRLAVLVALPLAAAVPAAVAVRDHLDAALVWGLALEGFALVAALAATSYTVQRVWRVAEPAQFLFVVVLLVPLAEQLTAGRWTLLAGPGEEWSAAHGRWGILAAVCGLLLAWQLRDPAMRRLLRRS